MTWTISFYVDEYGRVPVGRWLNELSPAKRELFARFVSETVEVRGPTLLETPLLKSLGSGLSELRIRGRLSGVGQEALLRVCVCSHCWCFASPLQHQRNHYVFNDELSGGNLFELFDL